MCRVLIATVVLMLVNSPLTAREWIDASGRYREEASFEKMENGSVWLKKKNGSRLIIEFDKLSAANQAYIVAIQRSASAKPVAPTSTETSLAKTNLTSATRRASSAREASSTIAIAQQAAPIPAATKPAVPNPAAPDPAAPIPAAPTHNYQPKYIYSGCCGTFHLLGDVGTASYRSPFHGYLSPLKYWKTDLAFIYYHEVGGHPYIIAWRFSRIPMDHCCRYSVEYLPRYGVWCHLDFVCRDQPR